jgi:hypothetical protein
VVKSGRSALTQIALPFDPFEEQMERDLDSWVDRICDLYPEQRARWQTRSEPEMQRPEATIRTGAAPDVDMSLLIEGMEMSPELEQELRRQMKEMGLEPPESFGG